MGRPPTCNPCCEVGEEDTPCCNSKGLAPKALWLFLQSGQFASTLKTSEDVGGLVSSVGGISWDGADTLWAGGEDPDMAPILSTLYLQSGQFSSTVKQSVNVNAEVLESNGISWDGTNTPTIGFAEPLFFEWMFLWSGKFTTTLKTTFDTTSINTSTGDISWDGTDTPWTGDLNSEKLYLQSGQFTSVIKTSLDVLSIIFQPGPQGISWDGINTPWADTFKMYLQSGQFSSTMLDSEFTPRNQNSGINTNKRTTG